LHRNLNNYQFQNISNMSLIEFKEFTDWKTYLKNKFHLVSSLFVIEFLTLCLFFFIHSNIGDIFRYEKIFFLIVSLLIAIYWLWYKYVYPKNRTKKTGVIICIYARTLDEINLKRKFLKELNRTINDENYHKMIKVIPLKNHQAKKIRNVDEVEKLHDKVDGRIYYYGDIQKEMDGEGFKYFIALNGRVKHKLIPTKVSHELSFDFGRLLPKNINFDQFFGLKGCKTTANMMFVATKYMVGIASFLSGNPFLAYELHKKLEIDLESYKTIDDDIRKQHIYTKLDLKNIDIIKKKLPFIKSNECFVIAKAYYENNNLENSKKYVLISLNNNPKNYSALLLKAILDFKLDNNIEGALSTIKKARKSKGVHGAWRYSQAFLLFWHGKKQEAWRTCRKIAENNYAGEELTIKEVEQFTLQCIKENPNKPELFFWLGYLHYKKTQNISLAYTYLMNFQEKFNDDDYLTKKANNYLSNIEKQMGIV
jgi:hypothetical protein